MKTNRFISALLLFVLAACQGPSVTPLPTVPRTPTHPVPTVPPSQATATTTAPVATKEMEQAPGTIAYAHVEAISEGFGPRVAGSAAEAKTAQYIVMEFERLGYPSELRPFSVNGIESANVIAVKAGASPREIIVGAHYDSVKAGQGADDNASGVAVILEVAKRIRAKSTPYTIRFILFGAEELQMQGSDNYVSHMTKEEIQNTLAMINLDSLTAGEIAYVYGSAGKQGAIRDWSLSFAGSHNLTLQTQMGENPKYPAGTTGDWSDFVPFKDVGIPYAYFESTNWALGAQDGYTQVGPQYGVNGEIWHTKYDTLGYIDATFPGRVQERLHLYVTLLEAILTQFEVAK